MVDSGRGDHNSSKPRAYTSLAAELKHRDGDEYQLYLFHHVQKLQKVYAAALKDGWTTNAMTNESNIS